MPPPRSFLLHEPEPEEDVDASDEAQVTEPREEPRRTPRQGHRRLLVLLALGLVAGAVVLAIPRVRGLLGSQNQAAVDGTLVLQSDPAGWHVWDGEVDRGETPLTLTCPPGPRTLVLRRGTSVREVRVDVAAGARTVYHFDLPGAPASGDLHVDTKPPGAIVAIDGIGQGTTPVDVRDLKAGRHVVTVLRGDRVLSETVTIEAGRSASLVVPLDEAGTPAIGWVTVRSAIDLEIFEGESLVGSSRNPRLMFMPGRHVLRLANRDLHFETTSAVQVRPGATAALSVQLPAGNLSVNAAPWADVWMDGVKIGETPMANYPAPLGSHEIVLRHPTLGEHRETVVVTADRPARLGVNLRR